MKTKTLLKILFATSLFSVFFFSMSAPTFALDLSKPLAGDSRGCGDGKIIGKDAQGNPVYNICPVLGIVPELKDVFVYAVIVIAFFAIISFVWIGVKGLTADDQAVQIKEARKMGGVALTSLLVAIFLIAFVLAVLNILAKPEFGNFFKPLAVLINDSSFGVSRAYAATTATQKGLPNPLVFNSIYDVGVVIYQLVMRWILVPVLIGSWVWAGFLFVIAQGNADKIKYAKSRLLYSAIWTVVLMLVLGLAYAFRDSFNQVIT